MPAQAPAFAEAGAFGDFGDDQIGFAEQRWGEITAGLAALQAAGFETQLYGVFWIKGKSDSRKRCNKSPVAILVNLLLLYWYWIMGKSDSRKDATVQ